MLTRKQRDLLEFIHKRLQRDGIPPSFDEMKDALDLRSKSGIHRLVTALEERGFIRRLAHRARAIEIVKMPRREPGGVAPRVVQGDRATSPPGATPVTVAAAELPVMGRIAAGTPVEAISQVTHHVAVPRQMIASGADHYALEVKGDSMIGAGINDGDIAVIEEGAAADSGDIVVALVDGQEATLKRLSRRDGAIALEAANPAHETRVFRNGQVAVQGKLVGLIRTY